MEEQQKAPKVRHQRNLIGRVTSVSGAKTVVVAVSRRYQHPTFKKYVTRVRPYTAHDEKSACGVGDQVRIVESRPLSATKRWRVAELVQKSRLAE